MLVLATELSLALILACAEFLLSLATIRVRRWWPCVVLLVSGVAVGCSCKCPLLPVGFFVLVDVILLICSIFTLSAAPSPLCPAATASLFPAVTIALVVSILTL